MPGRTGYQVRTWVSVSMSEVATSKRLGLDRYLLSLNWCSSSNSCWLVKAVRGLRHFPKRFDCAWAVDQKGERPLQVCSLTRFQPFLPLSLPGPSLQPPPCEHGLLFQRQCLLPTDQRRHISDTKRKWRACLNRQSFHLRAPIK